MHDCYENIKNKTLIFNTNYDTVENFNYKHKMTVKLNHALEIASLLLLFYLLRDTW